MIAYVLSAEDLSIKDTLFFEQYEFKTDIEFNEKSTITVLKQPNIEADDFVVCKDEAKLLFQGICENYATDTDSPYTITLKQMECLFDRNIFADHEEIIHEAGIEDYVDGCITYNWVDTGDVYMDREYIETAVLTHTPIAASVGAENGVFNFKTYLGNIRELYGIFTDFEFEDGVLNIVISQKDDAALPIDVTMNDAINLQEVYNINALAKLNARWHIEQGDFGISVFLKNDRTITDDPDDPDRAKGSVESVDFGTPNSEEELIQAVYDKFKANSYEHKITFDLSKNSRAYPVANYYVGREATIKTKTGIKTSIITGMSESSDSAFFSFTFGKLKVSLIEKIRQLGGNK